MKDKLVKFNLSQRKNKDIPELQAGDIVKVHRKIVEGQKERIQIFEGMVIAINGKQSSSPTITVRKVSNGVGVELVLPIFSPNVEKIEVVKKAKVRRSKLYYIRDKSAKSLRLKYKDMADFAAVEEPEKEESDEEMQTEESEGGKDEIGAKENKKDESEVKEEKNNEEEKESEKKPTEKEDKESDKEGKSE